MNQSLKKISALSFAATVLLSFPTDTFAEEASFNWTKPNALTPSYPAPDMDDRNGQTVSNVVFTSGCATFKAEDDDVKELSRKARFVFGYYTQQVELRVYAESDIVITVPEGKTIKSITFTGPEADSSNLISYIETSSWEGQTWIAPDTANVTTARFYANSRVELNNTTVIFTDAAGVCDIEYKSTSKPSWHDLTGRHFSIKPTIPGIYLETQNGKTIKIVISAN